MRINVFYLIILFGVIFFIKKTRKRNIMAAKEMESISDEVTIFVGKKIYITMMMIGIMLSSVILIRTQTMQQASGKLFSLLFLYIAVLFVYYGTSNMKFLGAANLILAWNFLVAFNVIVYTNVMLYSIFETVFLSFIFYFIFKGIRTSVDDIEIKKKARIAFILKLIELMSIFIIKFMTFKSSNGLVSDFEAVSIDNKISILILALTIVVSFYTYKLIELYIDQFVYARERKQRKIILVEVVCLTIVSFALIFSGIKMGFQSEIQKGYMLRYYSSNAGETVTMDIYNPAGLYDKGEHYIEGTLIIPNDPAYTEGDISISATLTVEPATRYNFITFMDEVNKDDFKVVDDKIYIPYKAKLWGPLRSELLYGEGLCVTYWYGASPGRSELVKSYTTKPMYSFHGKGTTFHMEEVTANYGLMNEGNLIVGDWLSLKGLKYKELELVYHFFDKEGNEYRSKPKTVQRSWNRYYNSEDTWKTLTLFNYQNGRMQEDQDINHNAVYERGYVEIYDTKDHSLIDTIELARGY